MTGVQTCALPISSAEVEGLQSQGVMAMVKHVAAYDQEQYPNGNNNETVSDQALQELYLAPFETSVKQAAPASFMCSYAVVNGNASCQNAYMQIDGLDNNANYGGFITSDWGGDYNNVASVAGGMSIGMPFPGSIPTDLANAITAGTIGRFSPGDGARCRRDLSPSDVEVSCNREPPPWLSVGKRKFWPGARAAYTSDATLPCGIILRSG